MPVVQPFPFPGLSGPRWAYQTWESRIFPAALFQSPPFPSRRACARPVQCFFLAFFLLHIGRCQFSFLLAIHLGNQGAGLGYLIDRGSGAGVLLALPDVAAASPLSFRGGRPCQWGAGCFGLFRIGAGCAALGGVLLVPGFLGVSFAIVKLSFDKLAQKMARLFRVRPAVATTPPPLFLPRKSAARCPLGGAYCIRLAVRFGFLYCVLLSNDDKISILLSFIRLIIFLS